MSKVQPDGTRVPVLDITSLAVTTEASHGECVNRGQFILRGVLCAFGACALVLTSF